MVLFFVQGSISGQQDRGVLRVRTNEDQSHRQPHPCPGSGRDRDQSLQERPFFDLVRRRQRQA